MSKGKASTFTDHDRVALARPTASKVLGERRARGRLNVRPERVEEERYCHCGTRLNAYNTADTCYTHTPRRAWRFRR